MGNNLSLIKLIPLKKFNQPAGEVMHALKSEDEGFITFGEAYFSSIKKGHIKAWKKHLRMTLNLIVPHGEVDFVFFSDCLDEFKILSIGANNYSRLVVPPGIWFGFTSNKSYEASLLLNIADILHDPNEVIRRDIESINFSWNKL